MSWAPTVQAAVRVAPVKSAPVRVAPTGVGALGALALPSMRTAGLALEAPHAPSALPTAAPQAAVSFSPRPAAPIAAAPTTAASRDAAILAAPRKVAAPAGARFAARSAALPSARAATAQRDAAPRAPGALGVLEHIDEDRGGDAAFDGGGSKQDAAAPVFGRAAPRRTLLQRVLRRGARSLAADDEIAGPRAPVRIPEITLASRLRDWTQYMRITGSSLFWYTFPRLFQRWDQLRAQIDAAAAEGRDTAVKQFVNFFIAHRVLGSTGSYAPMGFRVGTNRVVTRDAWRIFKSYFDAPPEAEDAFRRLIDRAKRHNPNRRSTQYRKLIFHALRGGSVMPRSELAAYFDGLATENKGDALAEFQRATQPRVLATFEDVVRDAIIELNKGLPRGSRVVGALLLGSFANGAAGPGSDFDVQTLSEDGSARFTSEFNKLLQKKWRETAFGDEHPVGGFQYALGLSKPLLAKVHREPYIIISPYPEVAAALSRTAQEDAAAKPPTAMTFGGFLFQVAYSHLLLFVLAGYGMWKFFRRLAAG